MVEKPLAFGNKDLIKVIFDEARQAKVILYTAYNHRFEPAFVRMKELLNRENLVVFIPFECFMVMGLLVL